MMTIKFIDYSNDTVMGTAKVSAITDTSKLEEIIKQYKKDTPEWEFDTLINDCLKKANIVQYPTEEIEEIYL